MLHRLRPRRSLASRLSAAIILLAGLAGLLTAADASAQYVRARPGIGETDPRIRINLREDPWLALGKLQGTTGNLRTTCTGALIAPTTVLTAAHCLVNGRTGGYMPPSSLHFLVGFDRGDFDINAKVLSFRVGRGYDPARSGETLGNDWALLTVDIFHGTLERTLPLGETLPRPGTPVMVGGYNQDQPLTATADVACQIVAHIRDRSGQRLLRHDCTGTRGTSGAPILAFDGRRWLVVGVNVAAPNGEAGGFAATIEDIRGQY